MNWLPGDGGVFPSRLCTYGEGERIFYFCFVLSAGVGNTVAWVTGWWWLSLPGFVLVGVLFLVGTLTWRLWRRHNL